MERHWNARPLIKPRKSTWRSAFQKNGQGAMENRINYRRWLELQHYREMSIISLLSAQTQLENYLQKHQLAFDLSGIQSFIYWSSKQGYSLSYQANLQWIISRHCSYLRQVHGSDLRPHLPKVIHKRIRRKALSTEQLSKINNWLQKQEKDRHLYLSLIHISEPTRR